MSRDIFSFDAPCLDDRTHPIPRPIAAGPEPSLLSGPWMSTEELLQTFKFLMEFYQGDGEPTDDPDLFMECE